MRLPLQKWGGLILCGVIFCLSSAVAGIASSNKSKQVVDPPRHSSHELLIQLKKNARIHFSSNPQIMGNATLDSLNALFNLKSVEPFAKHTSSLLHEFSPQLLQTYLFSFDNKNDIPYLQTLYQKIDIVELAEPNFIYATDTTKSTSVSSPEQCCIEKSKLREKRETPVIVGIIDTGFDWQDATLKKKLWRNPQEREDGKDNDVNGFSDDIIGWDFTATQSDKQRQIDMSGRGRLTARTIAAIADQSDGPTNLQLMILKAGSLTKNNYFRFNVFDVARAIFYAAENGADIIHISCYGDQPSGILHQAVQLAAASGCTILCPAGSENSDAPHYPGAYEDVIAVTAVNSDDQILPHSNFGDWVSTSAPGFGFAFETQKDTVVRNYVGTSIATAYVSGLAAKLLCSENINSGDSLKHRILWSCDNIYKKNQGLEGKLGAGRINVRRAMEAIHLPNIVIQTVSIEKQILTGSTGYSETYAVKLFSKNFAAFAEDIKINLTCNNENISIENAHLQIPKLGFQQEYNNQENPFLIRLKNDAEEESQIYLKLSVEAKNNYKLTKDISIQTELKPPKLLTAHRQRPVKLQWPQSERFISYNIYRKRINENNFAKITRQPVQNNEFTDSDITPDAHYIYYITGINSEGLESPPSGHVSVILPEPPDFSFSPEVDTIKFTGDSLEIYCTRLNEARDEYTFSWKINDNAVSIEDSLFYLTPAFIQSDSTATITLQITSAAMDTSLIHEWMIIPPEIHHDISFDFFPKNDTTIACGDSIQFHIDADPGQFVYQWAVSDSIDSAATDDFFQFVAPNDSGGGAHISAIISDSDTTISFAWEITYRPKFNPTSLSVFSPSNDTTISEGDSIAFSADFPFQIDQDMKIEWTVNGKIDSSVRFTRFGYQTDYFSSGVDTVAMSLDAGDSLYHHIWLVTVENRNRPPQILSKYTLSDSIFAPGDTLEFFVHASDPDLDTLHYTWSRNHQQIDPGTDSAFSCIVNQVTSTADTYAVKIADADTSIEHVWIVNYNYDAPKSSFIFAFSPETDTLLMNQDSVRCAVHLINGVSDSLFFRWFINGFQDTTAHDSSFVYASKDSSFSNDTIRVEITAPDTFLFREWIAVAIIPAADSALAPAFSWFPETDSVFFDSDSISFGSAGNYGETEFQWFVNQRRDSTATDSVFTFFKYQKVHSVDTIQVLFSIEDSLRSQSWNIFYPEQELQRSPFIVQFSPAEKEQTCTGRDSLHFAIKILEGWSQDVTVQWMLNQQSDSTKVDTTFCFFPDDSTATTDTISVIISNADTTIIRTWYVESLPYVLVAAPRIIFPVEEYFMSEENTFMWENDSSLIDFDNNMPETFVLQLSEDSTFAQIISSDTCAATSVALKELSSFSEIQIGQPIYWRIQLRYDVAAFSEFVRSPHPFYYQPLFSRLENFSGQQNENGSITFSWNVTYADNCEGFNVYRSESQDDFFNIVNDNLITGQDQFSFQDGTTLAGKKYYYKLEEVTHSGLTKFHHTISVTALTPENYSLSQNFPNPFNMKTSFKYQIPTRQHVLIEVYNVLGRKLKTLVNDQKEPGFYTVYWDGVDDQGKSVVSGIYFYHIAANGYHMTRKMIIVR